MKDGRQVRSVLVIGGGPAGMMAAAAAGSRGLKTILLEKNHINGRVLLGKKLRITGNSRCNVTNDTDINGLINHIPTNGKFLYSAFYHFAAQDTIDLLNRYGVPTKIEDRKRVIPESEQSKDVVEALKKYMHEQRVEIAQGEVNKIEKGHDGKYVVVFQTIEGASHQQEYVQKTLVVDSVIIATGGKSHPQTGSTGDGYEFARQFGHTVTPLRGSLVPVVAEESWIKELQGISLRDVTVTVKCSGRKSGHIYKTAGDILFTHYGVTGPAILFASAHMKDYQSSKYILEIDLLPQLTKDCLDRELSKEIEIHGSKQINSILQTFLPKNLIHVLLKHLQICYDKHANQISHSERMMIVGLLKKLIITVGALRSIREATVTSGGICVKEVNPKTMESKLHEGLFFAGEVLDVDGYTGGYNIQIAISTGHVAGLFC